MRQMRLTQSFAGLLTCGLSLMPIAARADVAALFADYDGAQPKRGLAQSKLNISLIAPDSPRLRFVPGRAHPDVALFVRCQDNGHRLGVDRLGCW
jgi:hypothetical protein